MKIKARSQYSEVRRQNKRKSDEHYQREYNSHRLFILTSGSCLLAPVFRFPAFTILP